jgi:GTP cyclohydrolase I
MIKDVHSMNVIDQANLKWVGIKNHPFKGHLALDNELQLAIGKAKFAVSLKKSSKGVHMSRISEELNNFIEEEINNRNLEALADRLAEKVESEDVWINLKLNLMLKQISPVSQKIGFDNIKLVINHYKIADKHSSTVTFHVIGTSLCPASKTNSKFGAHSQRSMAKVTIPFGKNLNKYLELIYSNFSARTYPILKMVDEVFVTEGAYSNPKFVEDLTRDLVKAFKRERLPYLKIVFQNYESIHNYDVFAEYKE